MPDWWVCPAWEALGAWDRWCAQRTIWDVAQRCLCVATTSMQCSWAPHSEPPCASAADESMPWQSVAPRCVAPHGDRVVPQPSPQMHCVTAAMVSSGAAAGDDPNRCGSYHHHCLGCYRCHCCWCCCSRCCLAACRQPRRCSNWKIHHRNAHSPAHRHRVHPYWPDPRPHWDRRTVCAHIASAYWW